MLEFIAGPLKLVLGFLVFAALALGEQANVGRGRPRRRGKRWPLNFTFLVLGGLLGRILAGVGPVAVALWANGAGFGLFALLCVPLWLAMIAGFLVMDLALYVQHRGMHEFPALWRLHRAHHTDPTLDVTTAFRFHPGELAASLVWKSVIAAGFGMPALAVAVFEIWLLVAALFTHADVRLPTRVEKLLAWLIATPGVHEQHHDRDPDRQRSNYSSGLTLWDRVFGSWRTPPDAGVAALGVHGVSDGLAADIARGLVDPIAEDAPYVSDR
ncbi:MAG: sterol desaturase family protein [Caulobacterales bacterium]